VAVRLSCIFLDGMDLMDSLVSICIPTYERPKLLLEAVYSCLSQSFANIEIIISDDSPDDVSERLIAQIGQSDKIRYYRNTSPLRQSSNVNQLFDLALGEYLILLHDDDLLLSNAIKSMLYCFQENPGINACFGKQQIIDMQSRVLDRETEILNQDYYRTEVYSGLQTSTMKSALLSQFPNDGYLVKTEIARSIGYRDSPEVGDACDYDFGLRLAAQSEEFYFLNQFTAAYRLTDVSILKGNNYTNLTYNLISSLEIPESLEIYRIEKLRQHASPAINKYLQNGDKHKALDIYFSSYYRWVNRLSVRGIIQGILLILPNNLSFKLLYFLKMSVKNSG
jgi:glycosyltransferase involved in cell wall biosynthesis